jgi:ribonuclease BN (tRNA processing enzyme)
MKKIFVLIVFMLVFMTITSCVQTQDIIEDNLANENSYQDNQSSKNRMEKEEINDTNGYQFSVITVGSGMPQYSKQKANASTVIQYNDKYYIIDCGEGSYDNMLESGFDFKKVAAILFTHHHIDHTTDFFDIYNHCIMSNASLEIVGPPRTTKFVAFYNDIFLDDVLYRKSNVIKHSENIDKNALVNFANITEIIGEDEIEIDGIKINAKEMTHTMYDIAYRFNAQGKSIVVSGDTSYDENLISLSKDADIIVIDGTTFKPKSSKEEKNRKNLEPFYAYGGNFEVEPHLTFDDMVDIAAKANVKTLVITHFQETTDDRIENSIAKIKEKFDGEVIYASDMMEIDVLSNDKSIKNTQDLTLTYNIVDTNQTAFYSDHAEIDEPSEGDKFYGQDATYSGNKPSYTDNLDGTILDEVTGLMWAKDMGEKMTYDEAVDFANESSLARYDDWRIPTIKELYSLIMFDGKLTHNSSNNKLFIDTDYFNQPLGDTSVGERDIDAQTWSSTFYKGKTMGNSTTIFGVNFVDGRIKGYPTYSIRDNADKKMYFRLVRGDTSYGENNYVNNHDGTITDLATGLTWQQSDSGYGMEWEDALLYAEDLKLAGYDDWRLANAKELQSIVDYNRSVQATQSPAINEMFETSSIVDVAGNKNYPYFWSSTSHLDGKNPYSSGVYIAFGEALGEMHGNLLDVHGAGAQRSDPKSGDEDDYPTAFGPQGDIRIVYNYVRCVRDN